MVAPKPVDPSKTPALSGVFAPVHDERDAAELSVKGRIPSDLRGAYLRNGPNPLFPPLGSYTFPLEGDAMLHGIWIDDDGSVRYRNRIVWTPQLRLEQRAGKALWAGLMTPYLPGPDVVPAQFANDFKPAPFINIVHHGGRWLALSEVDPPWEVSSDLEVTDTSPFTWGGAIPGMCAHPRIDPLTGEMVLFRYNLEEPYLMWASIAADGTVSHQPDPVDVDGSYMIHDFVLTSRYVVLFVAPAQFDLPALLSGEGPPLAWNSDKPVRIAVIPRDGTSEDVRWIETDPFWAYHFANGYDDGEEIVVDFSRFGYFALGPAPDQTGAVTRAHIDAAAGTVKLDTFDDRITEFPCIDNRLQTLPHRYVNVSAKTEGMSVGEYNLLLRVDTLHGTVADWNSGRKVFDEIVFAPAEGGNHEQGYYTTFRTDLDTLQSDWIVLDADDISAGPVATVDLPFRVPAGLHGNWFSTSAL
jgi:carotenoid cleavage dioxygenase-like enzyme